MLLLNNSLSLLPPALLSMGGSQPSDTVTINGVTPAIRNPAAYAATARGNQDRVTQALATVRDHPTLDSDAKQTLGDAVATLGSTSSRADADAIVQSAVDALPRGRKAEGLSILSPLSSQIKQ